MGLEGALVAVAVMFGSVYFSGILSVAGPTAGKALVFLDRTEVYLHHEFELMVGGAEAAEERVLPWAAEAAQVIEEVAESAIIS